MRKQHFKGSGMSSGIMSSHSAKTFRYLSITTKRFMSVLMKKGRWWCCTIKPVTVSNKRRSEDHLECNDSE